MGSEVVVKSINTLVCVDICSLACSMVINQSQQGKNSVEMSIIPQVKG